MEATKKLSLLTVGATFSLAVAIMYSVCTGAWLIWHEGALDFLNALFHGLDFRKIQVTESALTLQMFFFPLLVMAAWAFATGTLFAAIYNIIQSHKTSA